MPRLRPAIAGVFVLVLTAGSFWGSAGIRGLRRVGEWDKERKQEGLDTIEAMLNEGRAKYWIENDAILHMTLNVNEIWYPDEAKGPLKDHSPLGMANMAHDWADRKEFRVPLHRGDKTGLPVDPVLIYASVNLKRVMWSPAFREIKEAEIEKIGRNFKDLHHITVAKADDRVWATSSCVDQGRQGSVGFMLNDCAMRTSMAVGECLRVSKGRGRLKLQEQYSLELKFILRRVLP